MIPAHGTWSAGWTRKHLLKSIPAIWDDRVYFIDTPNEAGATRKWFVEVWLERRVFPVWVLSQTFLTSPTGSLQTSTSDATWNNANNKVETVGPGGSGGETNSGGASPSTGGGGGAYSAITNFTFATPGTTTYQWQVGTGGAAVSGTAGVSTSKTGNPGASATWFNAAADPGNGADNSKCSAAAGGGGTTGSLSSSGAGGATTAGWGTTKNAGGRGGQMSGSGTGASGGGGAAGPNGAGVNGGDATTASQNTAGGNGDNGSGGAGHAGAADNTTVIDGAAGTELGDSVHGCGGGGGARLFATNAATIHAGNGGLYGAAGGGSRNTNTGASANATSGAGAAGIIVLTWTPATFTFMTAGMPLLFM